MKSKKTSTGIVIAAVILCSWTGLLVCLLTSYKVDFWSPLPYLFVLLQTHLYTGLFITAHDAMHGVVAPGRPKLNKGIGTLTAFLFAYNSYARLLPRHHQHHSFVATDKDPDYHNGTFWAWYFSFLKQYITWWQLVLMAITFNVLQLYFPLENIILFWMLPAILGTFQLFYFGTYQPHRGEHTPENKYKSTTQAKNHVWAFLSCYFFGYHFEHHHQPYLPWWQLYKSK